jgi:hypothetical protein
MSHEPSISCRRNTYPSAPTPQANRCLHHTGACVDLYCLTLPVACVRCFTREHSNDRATPACNTSSTGGSIIASLDTLHAGSRGTLSNCSSACPRTGRGHKPRARPAALLQPRLHLFEAIRGCPHSLAARVLVSVQQRQQAVVVVAPGPSNGAAPGVSATQQPLSIAQRTNSVWSPPQISNSLHSYCHETAGQAAHPTSWPAVRSTDRKSVAREAVRYLVLEISQEASHVMAWIPSSSLGGYVPGSRTATLCTS